MTGTEELQDFTTGIADAIREKTGTTEEINPQDFAAAIYNISGGSSGGGSSAYEEVNHGTSDRTFELTPNTFHVWDEMAAMTLTLGDEIPGVANEYVFQFTSPATPTSLTLPDDIKFSEDLVIEANKIYQISILKGLGSVLSWDNAKNIFPLYFEVWADGSYSGVHQPDANSIALADYVVGNLVSDGTAYDCYIPEGAVYIDGHEVSNFSAYSSPTNPYEWWFRDNYEYPGMYPVTEFYVSGSDKGLMRAYDDD